MPTSKLEMYLNIVKSLMESGPQTLDQIYSLLNVNQTASLKQRLDFLADQGMIKEKEGSPKVTYIISARGIGVLKFFRVVPSKRL